MAVDVLVPSLGDGVTHGTLIRWLKQPGERVEMDEALFEISADKVDAEVPAPTSGVLVEQIRQPGDEVRVGSLVARIGTVDEWRQLDPPDLRPSHSLAGQSLLGATLHSAPPGLLDELDDGPITTPATPALSAPAMRSRVALIAESAEDEPLVEAAVAEVERCGLGYERHRLRPRTPGRIREFAHQARERALRAVIVCGGAGGHLAAMVAAESLLPVVAVPRLDEAGGLAGLLGASHVPAGLPVVTVAPGERGARQAVVFLARLVAAFDVRVARALADDSAPSVAGGFSGELF